MSTKEENAHESRTFHASDGGRPEIEQYDSNSTFRPNDQVYILVPQRRGPYTVREVSNGKCTLIDEDGNLVDYGNWFDEYDLELDD